MNKKRLFAFAMASMPFFGTIQAQGAKVSSAKVMEEEQSWTIISNQDGIKISGVEKLMGEKKYLYLKFENTTQSDVSFAWEMKSKAGKPVASNNYLTISAGSTLSGFDDATINGGNMNILLEANQSLSDFIITINKK